MKQHGVSVSSAAQCVELVQKRFHTYGEIAAIFEEMVSAPLLPVCRRKETGRDRLCSGCDGHRTSS